MSIFKQGCYVVAAGFGSGWLPKAPGTWGSLASLPIVWWSWQAWGIWGVIIACVAITCLACMVCAVILVDTVAKDPSWIVVDEWAGQCFTLLLYGLFYPLSWLSLCFAFMLFRLFDIWKPFPIRTVENIGPSWWSITADDLVAGAMAGSVLLLLHSGYLELW